LTEDFSNECIFGEGVMLMENRKMKRACRDQWEAIVELAEGRVETNSASSHLSTCAECQGRFAELTRMFSVMAIPRFSAPTELQLAAKSLMPKRPQAEPIRMRLIHSSWGLSGARSSGQDFQAIYGHESAEVRMMYTLTEDGWEVTGRLPDPQWQAFRDETTLPTDDDGRFFFLIKSLADSGITLVGPTERLTVPAGSLALDEEFDGSNDRV
jgi:hypothetical protein